MASSQLPCVVVGVDRSVAGLRALRLAVVEARRRGVMLCAVRAWDVNLAYGDYAGYRVRLARREAEQTITDAFGDILGDLPTDVAVQRVTPLGVAGPLLVEYASRDEDVLFVGRDRHAWLSRLFRRSVSAYCVRHARCLVQVVPPDAFGREMSGWGISRTIRRDLADLANL